MIPLEGPERGKGMKCAQPIRCTGGQSSPRELKDQTKARLSGCVLHMLRRIRGMCPQVWPRTMGCWTVETSPHGSRLVILKPIQEAAGPGEDDARKEKPEKADTHRI